MRAKSVNKVPQKRSPLVTSGLILRNGTPPPPVGPARTSYCLEKGLSALGAARSKFGRSLYTLAPLIEGGLASLPPAMFLSEPMRRDDAVRVGKRRVQMWFGLRNQIRAAERAAPESERLQRKTRREQAEKLARDALEAAVEAFNWLDDILFDYPPHSIFKIIEEEVSAGHPDGRLVDLGDTVDEAHLLVHRVGELVGGIFGCLYKHGTNGWEDRCPTQLMHIRRGNSPGMIVKYACSICAQDPGECPHVLGGMYSAVARREDGHCNICGASDSCEHVNGETYLAKASALVANILLSEVSLVIRPRDPLARIHSRTVDERELVRQFGRVPGADVVLLCHGCMFPCQGLRRQSLPDSSTTPE